MTKNNQPIGILDSGFGGLSIWKDVVRELPNESIVYAGDNANCPYGNRAPEEIQALSKQLVQFLVEQDVKLIVVACNTITVHALSYLRSEFPGVPIVGTVPVVKTASERTKSRKIGILSTIATSKSYYQKKLIEQFAKGLTVLNLGTDKLVPLVEAGDISSVRIQEVLEEELEPFKKANIDVLALGCSHFPFLKEQIQQILGSNLTILDSGAAIARQVRRVITTRNELSVLDKPVYTFYTSGNTEEFKRIGSALIGADLISKVETL
jgi:glutamate racemase